MARAKEFDENDVLDKAMRVFWKQGYEHTSMQNLVDAMSIHRRSIYDTFGDKHQLFLKSLNYYETMIQNKIVNALDEGMSIKEQLKLIFTLSAGINETNSDGCLIVNTVAELASTDPLVSSKVALIFDRSERQIFDLLTAAQKKKQLSKDADIERLTYYLHNALIGIRVLTKTTTDSNKLEVVIDQTLEQIK